MEDLVREIMEDIMFKGNQNFHFEMDMDELGRRLFGGEANAGVSFQIGQLRNIQLLEPFILDCTWYTLIHTGFHHGLNDAGLETEQFP